MDRSQDISRNIWSMLTTASTAKRIAEDLPTICTPKKAYKIAPGQYGSPTKSNLAVQQVTIMEPEDPDVESKDVEDDDQTMSKEKNEDFINIVEVIMYALQL